MALLKQFGTEDEEILKRMRSQSAPISRPEPVFVNPQQAPVPAQPQSGFRGILGNIASGLQDREKLMQLGMVLSSMNPNSQNLTNVLQYNLDTMKEDRELKSQANKTAEFFKAQGRDDLAMAIKQNPAIASDILKAYYGNQFKTPSVFEQKIKYGIALGKTPEEAYQSAISGEGTTINMPSGAETAMYKAASDRDFALQDQAYKAASQIAGLDQTIDLIESGEANIGMASQFQQELARMKAFFGDEESIKSASSTALLNALLGQDVFGAISNLGIGARGLDTPAEREFLRDVLTGTTRMTPEALLKMTNLRKKYAEKVIEKYNDAVERGQFDYISGVLGPNRFQKIDYLLSDQLDTPPQGVDPTTWGYMTRDEKVQYLKEMEGAGK